MPPTIEELEQACTEANAAYHAAFEVRSKAASALTLAKINATGLLGHVVEGPKWGGSSKVHRILVTGFGWNESKLSGPILKKDGTPGERFGEVELSSAKDIGVHFTKTAA